MYDDRIPWWFQLFVIPLWGTPIYLVLWTVLKARAERRKLVYAAAMAFVIKRLHRVK